VNRRRPLIAALITAATVATVAVPAGAASSKDWVRATIPCATGHKAAVLGYSPTHPYWVAHGDVTAGGSFVVNPHRWASWFSNPCKGQWLHFATWDGELSEDSYTAVSVASGMSGKVSMIDPNLESLGPPILLSSAPYCTNGGGSVALIQKPGAPSLCP
jgi:hypothetical protein